MATVRRRKREMVERQVAKHLEIYRASGAELIMGSGRFVAPKTLEVNLNDGGTRQLTADKVFLNLGCGDSERSWSGSGPIRPTPSAGSTVRLSVKLKRYYARRF
jgi:pyruvate/2-oxoglutarate dehydrogenase complex dihydrolipoamide dehydrogenase (E3) component